ncbi:hypothetical protein [Cohnella sp.]|uniref:hypothetical protein n=1 Tax=Cohnella sp. TaxID=1883426 RepID=UPI00356A5651
MSPAGYKRLGLILFYTALAYGPVWVRGCCVGLDSGNEQHPHGNSGCIIINVYLTLGIYGGFLAVTLTLYYGWKRSVQVK